MMELLPVGPEHEGYLRDESRLAGRADFIAFPESTAELTEALRFAKNRGLPVTVQGSRTGLAGGAVPRGGLIISLSRFGRILGLEEKGGQRYLRVQAGARLLEIEAYAASRGCFFPPNPTESSATVGGTFATGAAGPSSLSYGASSQYIDALCWLTAEGEIWDIERGCFVFDGEGCSLPDGRRLEIQSLPANSPLPSGLPRKGLDLIDFLAGSEGRLGIAAELGLALLPLPSQSWGVVYFFTETERALAFGEGLRGPLQQRVAPCLVCAEFMDSGALSRLSPGKLGLPEFPEGARAAVYTELAGEDAKELEAILGEHLDLFARLGEREENTWAEEGASGLRRFRRLRHAAAEAAGEQAGIQDESGQAPPRMETDFSGPAGKAADYVRMYRLGLRSAGLSGMVYGHLLRNRLHAAIFCAEPEELEKAKGLMRKWAEQVMADGGLLVSENGVGRLKSELLRALMPEEVRTRRDIIKDFFDPEGRLG